MYWPSRDVEPQLERPRRDHAQKQKECAAGHEMRDRSVRKEKGRGPLRKPLPAIRRDHFTETMALTHFSP